MEAKIKTEIKTEPEDNDNYAESYPNQQYEVRKTEKCKICGKEFFLYSDYILHTKVHEFESRFKCPNCPRDFGYSATLKTHLKTCKPKPPSKNKFVPNFKQRIVINIGSPSTSKVNQKVVKQDPKQCDLGTQLLPLPPFLQNQKLPNPKR